MSRGATAARPNLGDLRRGVTWVWVCCEARGCHHYAPLALARAIIRCGASASSDMLRTRMRCTKCGARESGLRHPSHVNTIVGLAPFPVRMV